MKLTPQLFHWIVRPQWIADKYVILIRDHFQPDEGPILDYGCGVGSYCTFFSKKAYLGVDKDIERVGYARRRHPGYRFFPLSKEKIALPLRDTSVDGVMVISVLHHMPSEEIVETLKEFRRVLKPKGKILFIEPCLSPKSKIRNKIMVRVDDGKYIRTQEEYVQLLAANGYETALAKMFQKFWLYHELLFLAFPK